MYEWETFFLPLCHKIVCCSLCFVSFKSMNEFFFNLHSKSMVFLPTASYGAFQRFKFKIFRSCLSRRTSCFEFLSKKEPFYYFYINTLYTIFSLRLNFFLCPSAILLTTVATFQTMLHETYQILNILSTLIDWIDCWIYNKMKPQSILSFPFFDPQP